MKVLLVNGSPHQKGETHNALSLVEKALNEKEIETEWFWIGNKPVRGCIDCGQCGKSFRCAFSNYLDFKEVYSIYRFTEIFYLSDEIFKRN